MKLDAFYLLEKSISCKTRYDVVSSSNNYKPFEILRKDKNLWFYFTSGDYTNEKIRRKTKWKLSSREGHISKVFDIDEQHSLGDVKGTTDLIIFRFINDRKTVHLFISKGRKNDDHVFRCLVLDRDPEFLDELNSWIKLATGKGD